MFAYSAENSSCHETLQVQACPANKWSMAFGRWLLALFLHLLWTPALGSIVSKSSLSQCTAYGNSELRNNVGAVCSKKLVVAMAITANEVRIYSLILRLNYKIFVSCVV